MLQLAATITRCVYQNPLNSRQDKKNKNTALRASTVRPKVTRKVWLQMDEAQSQPELRKSETGICSDFCTLSVFCLDDTQEKCASKLMHIYWRKNGRTAERKKSQPGGQREHEDSPRLEC